MKCSCNTPYFWLYIALFGGKMSIIGLDEAWAIFYIALFGVKKHDIGPEITAFHGVI
jgi:hypothetical protein